MTTVPFEPPCTAQTRIYPWIPSIPELSLDLYGTDTPRGKQWKIESPFGQNNGEIKKNDQRKCISWPYLQSGKANYPNWHSP